MTDMAQQTERPAAVNKETVIEIHPDPDKMPSESLNPKSKKVVEKIEPLEYVTLRHDIIWPLAFSLIVMDLYMKLMVVMLTPKGDTWSDYMPVYCTLFALCLALLCCYASIKWAKRGESREKDLELVKEYLDRFKMATAVLVLTLLMYSQPPFPIINISSPWVNEIKQLLYAPVSLVAIILSLHPDVDRRFWCHLATTLGVYFVMQLAVLLLKHTEFMSQLDLGLP